MLTYPEIAERAGTPIIASLWMPCAPLPGAPIDGLAHWIAAPGNAIGMARDGSVLACLYGWPGAIMSLEGIEANDNRHLGVIA